MRAIVYAGEYNIIKRKFDGKIYTFIAETKTKRRAKEEAKKQREKGYNARTTFSKMLNVYQIWTRRK